MGIPHAFILRTETWPADSRKPVAATFWTMFDQSLEDQSYLTNEVSLTNDSK